MVDCSTCGPPVCLWEEMNWVFYSSLVELSSKVVMPPKPRSVEFCAAETVSTVCRRINTRTHSLSLLLHSLDADETVSDVR